MEFENENVSLLGAQQRKFENHCINGSVKFPICVPPNIKLIPTPLIQTTHSKAQIT